MWMFFEHEDPVDWDQESGEEIMALQYRIRALSWLYGFELKDEDTDGKISDRD